LVGQRLSHLSRQQGSTEPWTLDLCYACHCFNTTNGSSWEHTAERTGHVDLAFTSWHVRYAESTHATAFSPGDWAGVIVRVWVTTTNKIITAPSRGRSAGTSPNTPPPSTTRR
jgi:hypothetical protein